MHFLFFIILITIASIPFLSFSNAVLYSIGLLLFLIFGQMAIGFGVLIVESILRGGDLSGTSKEERKDLRYGVWITRIIAFIIVLYVSYRYNIFLVIPAFIGISYWLFVEYVGEKKYKLRLS